MEAVDQPPGIVLRVVRVLRDFFHKSAQVQSVDRLELLGGVGKLEAYAAETQRLGLCPRPRFMAFRMSPLSWLSSQANRPARPLSSTYAPFSSTARGSS